MANSRQRASSSKPIQRSLPINRVTRIMIHNPHIVRGYLLHGSLPLETFARGRSSACSAASERPRLNC